MKNILKISLTLLIHSLVATFSMAADFHFSESIGDDSRSYAEAQNPNTPWKSIEKLNKIFTSLKPGDQVLFRRGETFKGSIEVIQSGEPGKPIVIGAYGNGSKPVVTSMVEIKNWKSKGNNLYEAHVEGISGDLSILTIAGTPHPLGRYPNYTEKNAGYLNIDSHNGEDKVSTNKLNTQSNFTGGEIVIRKNRWIIDRHLITSHSSSTFQYDPKGSKYKPQVDYGFFIQNHPATLDEKGEWYFDKIAKKLLLYYPNDNPSKALVSIATEDFLVDIRNKVRYIEIKGLIFEGSNQNNIVLENTESISITNCEIRYNGKNAVHIIASPNFTLQNSLLQHSYNGGVFLHWSDNYSKKNNNAIISNNVIEDTFKFPGMGRNSDSNGIAIYMSESANNGLIEFNKIFNTGYIGINFNGNNTIVKNNLLDTFCTNKDDGAGIYTWTGSLNTKNTNREVKDNIIMNGIGANDGTNNANSLNNGVVEGIYLDDNTNGVEITRNSISNIANSGIYIHNASNLKISNNHVYNTLKSLWIVHDHMGEPIRNLQINGNQFLAVNRDQKMIQIRSKENDISKMGIFEKNVYAHPLSQNNAFLVQSTNSSGKVIWKEFDLELWGEIFQHDQSSNTGPVEIPNYIVKSLSGVSKMSNGDFRSPLKDLYCWSPDNNCNIQIEEKGTEGGKALRIDLPSAGIVAFNAGSVTKGKVYQFTLGGVGSSTGLVKTYLRQSHSPYHIISESHTIKITEIQSDYSVLFTKIENEDDAVIVIESQDSQNSFWLENMALQEVEAQIPNPNEYFLFEFNETSQPKMVSVPGSYVDLKSNLISETLTLAPYSSIILIKKSDKISEVSIPNIISNIEWINPTPDLNIVEGDSITLKVEVDKDKRDEVEKINYFFGEKLIITNSQDPFSYTWKNVPLGKHFLYVEVFDKYGRVITSDSTYVEVRKENVAPLIIIESPTQDTTILEKESFEIKVSAIDLDGEIELIEFYANNELLGSTSKTNYNFNWNAIPEGNYEITVKVTDNEGLESITEPLNLSVQKPLIISSDEGNSSTEYSLNVNLGSNAEFNWESLNFNGEKIISNLIDGTTSTFSVSGNNQEQIFQTERFGKNFTLSIPVPNGTYTVKTYHSELWFGIGGPKSNSGQRVFDISLQDEVVKEKFDLFSINKNQPITLTFKNVKVTNGKLLLGLNAHVNNASISGLSIYKEGEIDLEVQEYLKPMLRLNTGHVDNVSYKGDIYTSDYKFSNYYEKSYTYHNTQASEIKLFQSARNGSNLKFSIPIPNGTYTIKTYHNELYFGFLGPEAEEGRRVFDINIENETVKKGFDLFLENKNQPTSLTFKKIKVTDGLLNIDILASKNRATISGFAIYQHKEEEEEIATKDYTFFLNTGGKSNEKFSGYTFISETTKDSTFHNSTSSTYSNSKATENKLFQTERNSKNLTYRIPVPNGSYSIFTMHNELYFGHAGDYARAGRRVFDISIEGELVEKAFDIYVKNNNQPTVLEFNEIHVTDGILDIEMLASQNRASVSGIAIMAVQEGNNLQAENLRSNWELNNFEIPSKLTNNKIQNESSNTENLIYPNPAKDMLNILLNSEITEGRIMIHDMNAKLISHFELNLLITDKNRYIIPLENLSAGMYLITISDRLEVVKRQRFTVSP